MTSPIVPIRAPAAWTQPRRTPERASSTDTVIPHVSGPDFSGRPSGVPASIDERLATRQLAGLGERYGIDAPDFAPGELASTAGRLRAARFLDAVQDRVVAIEWVAVQILTRTLGVRIEGRPTEVLARALGVAELDPRSLRALSEVASGEDASRALAEAPIANAIAALTLERSALSGRDVEILRSLDRDPMALAMAATDPERPTEVREAARKYLQYSELSKVSLDALGRRVERLADSGIDGRLRLDAFYAGASEDVATLARLVARGRTAQALEWLEGRSPRERAWMVVEYAATYGDGALESALARLDPSEASWIAEALLADLTSRAEQIRELVSGGVTSLDARVSEARARLYHLATAYERTVFSASGVTPDEVRLVQLRRAVERAELAVASGRGDVFERLAAAEALAESIQLEASRDATRAIATVEVVTESAKAVVVTAGAAAATMETLGVGAPAAAGFAAASWSQVAVAIGAATGVAATAGTLSALGTEAFSSSVLGRAWSWARVGEAGRDALGQGFTGATMAGLSVGAMAQMMGSATGRTILANVIARNVALGGVQGGASVVSNGALAVLQHPALDDRTRLALANVGSDALRTAIAGALLGPLTGTMRGARGVAWDGALGGAEQVAFNVATDRPVLEGVPAAAVQTGVLGGVARAVEARPVLERPTLERPTLERPIASRAPVSGAFGRGGTKGPEVYRLDNLRAGSRLGGLGPSGLAARAGKLSARLHGATPEMKDMSTLVLAVPVEGRVVDVEVTLRLSSDAKDVRAHGASDGAARLQLRSNGRGQYTADVVVNARLHESDVAFVLGHELDEISDIVSRHVRDPKVDMQAETRASVFTSSPEAGARATAHDRASVRELFALRAEVATLEDRLHNEQAALAKATSAISRSEPRAVLEKAVARRDRIAEAVEHVRRLLADKTRSANDQARSMGLDSDAGAAAKAAWLETALSDRELTASRPGGGPSVERARVEWLGVVEAQRAHQAREVVVAFARERGAPSGLSTSLVTHLLAPDLRGVHPHVPQVSAADAALLDRCGVRTAEQLAKVPDGVIDHARKRVLAAALKRNEALRRGGTFKEKGLNGGHLDAELHAFLARNPELGIVLVKTGEATHAGVTARAYEQYLWVGPGPVPQPDAPGHPASSARPTGAGWIKSKAVKTTVDDLSPLLSRAAEFNASRGTAPDPSFGSLTLTARDGGQPGVAQTVFVEF